MNDNEEILDSGEIYKELDPLELSIEIDDKPVEWTKVLQVSELRVTVGKRTIWCY